MTVSRCRHCSPLQCYDSQNCEREHDYPLAALLYCYKMDGMVSFKEPIKWFSSMDNSPQISLHDNTKSNHSSLGIMMLYFSIKESFISGTGADFRSNIDFSYHWGPHLYYKAKLFTPKPHYACCNSTLPRTMNTQNIFFHVNHPFT